MQTFNPPNRISEVRYGPTMNLPHDTQTVLNASSSDRFLGIHLRKNRIILNHPWQMHEITEDERCMEMEEMTGIV